MRKVITRILWSVMLLFTGGESTVSVAEAVEEKFRGRVATVHGPVNSQLRRAKSKVTHQVLTLVNEAFHQIVSSPIFIVGCGHSGTSLMVRILGAHPRIHPITEESYVFTNSDPAKRHTALQCFDLLAFQHHKARWIEKTPRHVYHLAEIFKERPDARVLLMMRDGRDVAVSLKQRLGEFEPGLDRWVNDNAEGEKWWDHPQVMIVRYEDLVADFDATIRDVLGFLGEEYCDQVRDYYKHPPAEPKPQTPPDDRAARHTNLRRWQVAQPLFDGRGKWQDKLSEQEKRLFKARAGAMLIRYGYARDNNW